MGCAHCGSTLLTTLLGRHSQIATVGELKITAIPDVNTYLCGCGEPLLQCDFWKNVYNECHKDGLYLDFNAFQTHYRAVGWLAARAVGTGVRGPFLEILRNLALKTWPSAGTAIRKVTTRNRMLIDVICRISDKPAFLDGSKDPIRLLHFVRSGEFDVRAIHLIRDGRAIVASLKKRNPDMTVNLHRWRQKTLECERAKNMLPDHNILTLRYEDLCTEPALGLARIFNFVGHKDESSECLSARPSDSKHIMGHHSRLGKHHEIKLTEDWKHILSNDDLALFTQSDRRLNRRYGYE